MHSHARCASLPFECLSRSCGGRAPLIFEVGRTAEPGRDLFVFEIGVANLEYAKAVHQEFAFFDDVDVIPIVEEGHPSRAVRNGAVAEELHGQRRHLRFRWWWRRGRRRRGMILVIMRTLRGWRRWKFPAEDVAATALVFGLTGFFDSSVVET